MTMIYTGTTISFQSGSKFHQAHASHPSFKLIVDLCKMGDYTKAAELIDLKTIIGSALKGSAAELRGSNVYYKGEIVNSVLARRILSIVKEGFDAAPLLLFLENLMSNPSKRAVDELYGFLEVSGLPITDDGHFLAYKSVKQDFTDHYTGTMDNSVGVTVSMPRNSVDEDKDRTCSNGLHFAAHQYASGFQSSGKMIVLKINPRDVVAIPSDYNNQKGRCCEYLVVEEVGRDDKKLVDRGFVDTGVVGVKVSTVILDDIITPKALSIGDTVILNAKGIQKWGDQSRGYKGVITKNADGFSTGDKFDFYVKWEDGHGGYYYKAKHLDAYVEPKVSVVVPKEPELTSKTVKVGESYMFSGRIFNSSLPTPFLGTVLRKSGTWVTLSTDEGHQSYPTDSSLPVTVTPIPEETEATPVVPKYIPQETNYTDKTLWSARVGFKGKNDEFPVDRDVAYKLTRMIDVKEYEGVFNFTNYDEKHDNLVFIRTDSDDFKSKYVTISNASMWIIQLA
jgi:hypothetical protein